MLIKHLRRCIRWLGVPSLIALLGMHTPEHHSLVGDVTVKAWFIEPVLWALMLVGVIDRASLGSPLLQFSVLVGTTVTIAALSSHLLKAESTLSRIVSLAAGPMYRIRSNEPRLCICRSPAEHGEARPDLDG